MLTIYNMFGIFSVQGGVRMATSSLSKTFYLNSKKEAKNFVSLLADSITSPSEINHSIKVNTISKERMSKIIKNKMIFSLI